MIRKAIIVLSVILALVTALVDLASQGRTLCCARPRPGDSLEIKFADGYQWGWRGLAFRDGSLRVFCNPEWPPSPMAALVDKQWDGFKVFLTRYGEGDVEFLLRLPLWLLLVLFALYPIVALIRGPYRRYRRRRKGLCVKCGYNLMGNVSGVCPECGERL